MERLVGIGEKGALPPALADKSAMRLIQETRDDVLVISKCNRRRRIKELGSVIRSALYLQEEGS